MREGYPQVPLKMPHQTLERGKCSGPGPLEPPFPFKVFWFMVLGKPDRAQVTIDRVELEEIALMKVIAFDIGKAPNRNVDAQGTLLFHKNVGESKGMGAVLVKQERRSLTDELCR